MAAGQAKIDLEFGLAQIRKKAQLYELYRNYHDGIHRLTFATKDWKNEFGTIFSAFADNLCPTVIGAVRNRLSVIGFSTMGDPVAPAPTLRRGRIGGVDDDADAAWALWNRNRMDRRQKTIYKRALVAGEVAVMVWTDPSNEREAVIYPQLPDKVAVRYSEERPGEVELAVKAWVQPDKRGRVTLYYADRVERWVTSGKTQGGLPDKADRLVEWSGKDAENPEDFELANPVGKVPIVMFGYDAAEGESGRSRLTDVVPLQDALNKAVADMLIAGEFQAVPQRLVIGWTPTEFDANGEPKPPWKSGADRILTLANENAKVAEWAAANLKAFIEEQDSFRAEIARVSQTPLHYLLLTGQFPSGDALHAAAEPLDAVVGDTQDGFGVSMEEVMDLALRFERGRGAQLTTLWRAKPSTKPKEAAETGQLKKTLKVSDRQLLREQGYSDPEINEMWEEQAEDDAGLEDGGGVPKVPFVAGVPAAGFPDTGAAPAPTIAAVG